MASLEALPGAAHGRRVRRGAATPAGTCRPAKSLRFLSAERSCTFRDRARQWWFAVAGRFQPGREAERVDLEFKEPVPVHALCPVHLSPRGGNHSRRLTNLCGVRFISRKAIFSA